jgi:hypothetical protein
MLVSTEKACYPDSSLSSQYPEVDSEWNMSIQALTMPQEIYLWT